MHMNHLTGGEEKFGALWRVPTTRLRARREGGFDSSQRVSRVPPSRLREKKPPQDAENRPEGPGRSQR